MLTQNGSSTLSITAPVDLNGNSTIGGSGSGTVAMSGALSGAGTLTKSGAYTLSLSANSAAALSGAVTISGGTLQVLNTSGSATGVNAVAIGSGGTLSGTGTISTNNEATRNVSTVDGATISPGTTTMGTLHIGSVGTPTDLVLTTGTKLSFRCGSSNNCDAVAITGNLTMGGLLTVADGGGIHAGTYPLFTYTGLLTNSGVTVSAVPYGLTATIDTTTIGAVNLVVAAPPIVQFLFTTGMPVAPTLFQNGTLYPPTSANAGVTATLAARVAELSLTTSSEAGTGGIVPPNAPYLKTNPNGNATTAAAAVQAVGGTYFEIAIQPNSGMLLNCSTLTFNAACGASQPSGYVVRSSVDNFSANLSQQDLPTIRPLYTAVSADLSGASFQNLATTLTFRFYAYSPSGGKTVDFDTIALNGVVVQAPTWQAASGNWSVAANWLPAQVPSSSASTSLFFPGTLAFSSNNDLGTFTLNTLTHAGATGGGNTISGNTIQFAGIGHALFQNGTVVLNISAPLNLSVNTTFAGTGTGTVAIGSALSGAGGLTLNGPYAVSLSADSSGFSGPITVSSGTLQVLNTTGTATGSGALAIGSGAILSGNGTIKAAGQTIGFVDGANLSPGTSSMGTMHVGAAGSPTHVALTAKTNLNFRCASGNASDLVVINGNLALGGMLSVTNAGGATAGTYLIFSYTGTLTNIGVTLVTLPAGLAGRIDTATTGQVNLVLSVPVTAATWSGLGGDGKWSTASNWSGNVLPTSYPTTVLTFPDLGATYATNNDLGPFTLNQIIVTGGHALTISGSNLVFSGTGQGILQNGSGAITVANNLVISAAMTFGGTGTGDEIINGVISESAASAVVKNGATFNLFFNAANLYSGGTTINGGALTVATDAGLGLSQ